MSWPSQFPEAYAREQAERCELLASEARTPEEAEVWQAQANEWRIELPPPEMEPGEIIDAEFIDIEP